MLSGSRAILVGLVFFVLVVGGSLLYSWHVHYTTDAELAQTDAVLQHVNRNETRAAADTVDASAVDFEPAPTSFETDDLQMSDDTGVSPIDETSEVLDLSDAFLPDDFVSAEAPAEDMPVSPFGYGKYPEIPLDYPYTPIWTRSEESKQHYTDGDSEEERILELMSRVRIKLWQMGEKNIKGIAYSDGMVYPNYPNTVYVDIEQLENGASVGVIGSQLSDEDIDLLRDGISPPGITVLDMSEGIEPISFLGL